MVFVCMQKYLFVFFLLFNNFFCIFTYPYVGRGNIYFRHLNTINNHIHVYVHMYVCMYMCALQKIFYNNRSDHESLSSMSFAPYYASDLNVK